ncbi:MAG: bifunctional oligoribonuclease/PAP phosphatase NrnA [Chloroflexi bacterium]|nr:bifunctional oligoribonuclease/PAP phosphatase NrnA [Chloroflexota bacterium]
MEHPNTFEHAVQLFRRYNKIFVAAHIMPDGDAIGSALGLTWALRKMGKTVNVTCNDHVSNTFDFLPGFAELTSKLPTDEEFLVYVDGSSNDRFGAAFDAKFFDGRPALEIDHHVTNDNFAPLNYVDPRAASTAEIIYRFTRALEIPLDPTIAQCLLTGVVTDTLGFRTSNTTVETLQTATALIQAGGSIPEIIENVFNRVPLSSLRLRGKVLCDAQLDGMVLWAQVPQSLIRELGVNGNGTGGIVNQLLSVQAAKIAVLFTEKENGKIDVGMRSRVGYDVATVARNLGGGGHKQASGALIDGPLAAARERVLAEIRKQLSNMPMSQ